jgi:superfamily II DNA helicase RecQ
VVDDIIKNLKLRDPLLTVTSFNRYIAAMQSAVTLSITLTRMNLFYTVRRMSKTAEDLCSALPNPIEPTIIYCPTIAETERLYHILLNKLRLNVRMYHASLSIAERQQVHDLFMQDKVLIIVATIAFGMGIDKPDVCFSFSPFYTSQQ